jgi:hypothetical protein
MEHQVRLEQTRMCLDGVQRAMLALAKDVVSLGPAIQADGRRELAWWGDATPTASCLGVSRLRLLLLARRRKGGDGIRCGDAVDEGVSGSRSRSGSCRRIVVVIVVRAGSRRLQV